MAVCYEECGFCSYCVSGLDLDEIDDEDMFYMFEATEEEQDAMDGEWEDDG